MASGHSRSSHHSGTNSSAEELVCNACGFEASFVPEGMLPCERCQKVHYCSLHCLQWDWKSGGHSNVCVDIRPVLVEDLEDDNEGSDSSSSERDRRASSGSKCGRGGGDDDEDESLISMDVNHLFEEKSKASSSVASNDESSTPTHLVSNTLQKWEEKSKNTSTATPTVSLLDSSSIINNKKTGGLKLGTFFENQKKQTQSLLASSNPVEEDEYEEEEIEVMSDSIDLVSGPDNLKSIVEESEVTGEEPDLEGSWRSRDPFLAAAPSNFANNSAPVSEGDEEGADTSSDQDNSEGAQEETEELVEDVTEEEIVEESYDSVTDDPSYEVMEVEEEDEGDEVVEAPAIKEPESEAFRQMKARSYGEKSVSRAMNGDQADGDNSSASSNGVDALMEEFGYDSNLDGESSDTCSTGSLEAETGCDTSRTEDTSRLAAQPSCETDPAQIKRLIDEDSTEDDDEDMLFAGVMRPSNLLKPTDISSLYTITSHHDSSNCTITTDEQSTAAAGQGSKEPSSSGASAGQASHEKSSEKSLPEPLLHQEKIALAPSPRSHDIDPISDPVAPPRSNAGAASTTMNRRGSAPTTLASDGLGSKNAGALPAPDTAQRRHSGPRSPSSLLDFRNVYSVGRATSTTRDHTQALKDFRIAYQADSTPPTTPSSTTTSRTAQSSIPTATSPLSSSVTAQTRTGNSPSQSPKTPTDPRSPGQSSALTVSINKAIRDYETLYGADAAQNVVLQLALGAESQEPLDPQSLASDPMFVASGKEGPSAAILIEPIIVATVHVVENGENSPAALSSSLSRESNPNTPPISSGSSGQIVPPNATESTADTGLQSETSSNSAGPRYLAYRNILSRGVATPDKSSERALATPVASNLSVSRVQDFGHEAEEAPIPAADDSSMENRQAHNVDPAETSPESSQSLPLGNSEESSEVALSSSNILTTASNEDNQSEALSLSNILTTASNEDNQSETPRYLAYRTQLALNSSRSSGLSYEARSNVDPVLEIQQSDADNMLQSTPLESPAIGDEHSLSSSSRYQNYRSHLAAAAVPTGAVVAATSLMSTSMEGDGISSSVSYCDSSSRGDAGMNGTDTESHSTAATGASPSVPRYLSYRESIARRVAHLQDGATETTSGIHAISEDEIDEADVEQRLSSYLHKGMIGAAAAAATESSGAPLMDSASSLPQPYDEYQSAALPSASGFTPEPLRSKRAAAALAMAKEAQRHRTQLKPVNGKSINRIPPQGQVGDAQNSTEVPLKSALKATPTNNDRDLEACDSPPLGTEPEPQDDQPAEKGATRSRSFLLTLLIVLWAVVALVVGLSVGLTNKYRKAASSSATDPVTNSTAPTQGPISGRSPAPTSSKPELPGTDAPEETPTSAPIAAATPSPSGALTQGLLDLLSSVSFDGGDSIQEAGSPQNEAFAWLSSSPDLATLSDERKVQRYALATLYYSTGGENWRSSSGWLSEDNECDWFSRSTSVCDSMGSLTDLSLGSNDLEGTLPAEIALLYNLTSIALGGSTKGKLIGTVPQEYANLSSMRFFSVRDNELEGQLSDLVEGWPFLEFFDVGSNLFTGTFPQGLTQQTELQEIDLSSNQLEGTIPDVSALTRLERLTLSDNKFSGALDGTLGELSALRYLNVQMNRLTSLPDSIGLLTALEVFEAYENNVSGRLFTALDGLTRLKVLDLHMNEISGEIPRDISLLTSLRYLDLSSNLIDGGIPSELGLLVNLIDLQLQSNRLSGVVPTELSGLRRLSQIRIDDNNITGAVPEDVCNVFGQTFPTFYLDCGGSSPQITCPPGPCCTYCCEENSQNDGSICQCVFEGTGLDYLCK